MVGVHPHLHAAVVSLPLNRLAVWHAPCAFVRRLRVGRCVDSVVDEIDKKCGHALLHRLLVSALTAGLWAEPCCAHAHACKFGAVGERIERLRVRLAPWPKMQRDIVLVFGCKPNPSTQVVEEMRGNVLLHGFCWCCFE